MAARLLHAALLLLLSALPVVVCRPSSRLTEEMLAAARAAVPNGTAVACVMLRPPFVLPRGYREASFESMRLPSGRLLEPSALAGVDVDTLSFVFGDVLGLQLLFLTFDTRLRLYLALRQGRCHLAAAASELTTAWASCTASCPPPVGTAGDDGAPAGPSAPDDAVANASASSSSPATFVVPAAALGIRGDYSSSDYTTEEEDADPRLCCLAYGVPYAFWDLALASMPQAPSLARQLRVSLASPTVVNAGMAMVLVAVAGGLAMHWLEGWRHRAAHNAPWDGVYWGVAVLTTFGDVAPSTPAGRVVAPLFMLAALVSTVVFGALLSSSITSALVERGRLVETLDSAPRLCYEAGNPGLAYFLATNPPVPGAFPANVGDCFRRLAARTVPAVLADRSVLQFYSATWVAPGRVALSAPVSRTAALAFVYPASSPLRAALDPVLIAVQTDGEYAARTAAIAGRYVGVEGAGGGGAGADGADGVPSSPAEPPLDAGLLAALVALVAGSLGWRWVGPHARRAARRLRRAAAAGALWPPGDEAAGGGGGGGKEKDDDDDDNDDEEGVGGGCALNAFGGRLHPPAAAAHHLPPSPASPGLLLAAARGGGGGGGGGLLGAPAAGCVAPGAGAGAPSPADGGVAAAVAALGALHLRVGRLEGQMAAAAAGGSAASGPGRGDLGGGGGARLGAGVGGRERHPERLA